MHYVRRESLELYLKFVCQFFWAKNRKKLGDWAMEIVIGIGLEPLIFGMSQDEVKSIWGKPDKITNEELEFAIIYYYNEKLIKTKFDRDEDLKLYSIEVFNPEVRLFNNSVIGKTKKEIERMLENKGYSKLVHEDYETFDTVFCEQIWTTFEFEFDRLKSIEFSPLFDNDEIVWPKRT